MAHTQAHGQSAPAPALDSEDLKALDQTRQRLFQLKSNIISLQQRVMQSNPLPPWSSLQASTSILVNNLQSLTSHLAQHSDQLNRTVVYPSTNYPGRTQEPLLGQLLRKKLEPSVEGWVEEGHAVHGGLEETGKAGDEEELWDWANKWLAPRIQKYAVRESGDHYTAEERAGGIENVRTGLRRKLEDNHRDTDEEDEEDDDEDEEMEDEAPAPKDRGSLGMGEGTQRPTGNPRTEDDILRFALTGTIAVQKPPGSRP